MGIINKLPTEISNKIAAGEVVERPVSVVKELVENAIDAGSTKIGVEIRNGGISYVRVTDNGSGMAPEDAEIAFDRHATSKISKDEDLDAIYTLGFRGEALSSIGAVSCIELYTKRKEDEMGTFIQCEGGSVSTPQEAGTHDGTTFIVQHLFYNTPARMKFLKRDATEAAQITDIMERFILSYPDIAFQYTIDGKDKYNTTGDGKLVNCIYAIYGKNYAKSIIDVDYEDEAVKVKGIIGKGDTARPNRGYQSFFVNKRYIKSPLLMKAVEEAYKNQIMIGKHPMVCLNVEINPQMIDINVHPTKLEVKFSGESEIYRTVYHAVKNALYAFPNVPKMERVTPERNSFVRDEAKVANQVEIPTADEPKVNVADIKAVEIEKVSPQFEPKKGKVWNAETQAEIIPHKDDSKKETISSYKLDISPEYFANKQEEADRATDQKRKEMYHMVAELMQGPAYSEPEEKEETPWGFDTENIKVVGQIFESYVIAQSGDTMIIADQHAAHERLKYEALKKDLESKQVTPQILMFPIICDLTPAEYVCYMENEQEIAQMGFETESFGTNSVLIRATPEAFDEDDLKQVFVEILDNFAENKTSVITAKMERALYTIACKAAVKANHKFDTVQLEKLLKEVFTLKGINTCPHGRPIIITMTKKELEKDFKRIL